LTCLPSKSDLPFFEELSPYGQIFICQIVTLIVIEEEAVAPVLGIAAARNDIDKKVSVGEPVEGRRHARGKRRRDEPWTQCDQKFQALRCRDERRGDRPSVLAVNARRQQHAVIAERVGAGRDPLSVVEGERPAPAGRDEITAVAGGRQEPQEGCSRHFTPTLCLSI